MENRPDPGPSLAIKHCSAGICAVGWPAFPVPGASSRLRGLRKPQFDSKISFMRLTSRHPAPLPRRARGNVTRLTFSSCPDGFRDVSERPLDGGKEALPEISRPT